MKATESKEELQELRKLNLYEKIQAVSLEVNNITKNMTVGSGNYSYKAVSDVDVTLQVKKAEAKFKLNSIPLKQEMIHHEILRGKKIKQGVEEETTNFYCVIKMTTKIIDLEDITQFETIESYGTGIDNGDKGVGKASTYARKYALLNAYKIASGEDPDAIHSNELNEKLGYTEEEKLPNTDNIKTQQELVAFFNSLSPKLQKKQEVLNKMTEIKERILKAKENEITK